MPIVEPEILMDGDHNIATTAAVQVRSAFSNHDDEGLVPKSLDCGTEGELRLSARRVKMVGLSIFVRAFLRGEGSVKHSRFLHSGFFI